MVDCDLAVQLLQFSDGIGVLFVLEKEGGKVSWLWLFCLFVCFFSLCVYVHLFFVEMNC